MRLAPILLLAWGPLCAQTSIPAFSAEQSVADHRTSLHATKILARRGDGARVVLQSFTLAKTEYPLDSPAYSRDLLLPDGAGYRLVDALRLKTTWPSVSRAEIANALGLTAPADCGIPAAGGKIIGRDVVEGQITLLAVNNGDDGRKTTQWMAPALGCTVLKSTVQEVPPNGPAVMVYETRLVRLTLGEPDAKLFSVGGDYAETRPSRVLDQQQIALHLDPQDRGGMALDRKYGGQ